MSSSSSSLPGVSSAVNFMPSQIRTTRQVLQVRAQSFFRDEGRSSNLVDGNMKVLKERIERVRVKERLERSCRRDEIGWNYTPAAGYNYNYKHKKQEEEEEEAENLSQYFQTLGLAAGGTFGLTILSATALLCLVSLMAHFHL